GVVAACRTAPIGPLWGWLVIGSVAGLALGLASAPRVQISNETVSTAADMIARSRWFSLYFSGMSSVAYFVILYPLIGFGGTAISALIGTAMGLGNNAWGRWVLVTRLYLLGRVTPDILGFLDAAHQRGVLGQSGPVYQFRHEELRRTLKPTRRPTQFAPQ
uniref:hypothetical protein n=1 Tax=Nocardia noduli TaxID=2815722 RepID=UPI001C219784